MGTVTIPLTTLPVGTQHFGPAAIADTDNRIAVVIDRMVAGGLDGLTPATTITLECEQSDDGGTTWVPVGGTTFAGGHETTSKTGVTVTVTTDSFTVTLNPGTSRQGRATLTVAGTSVAVQGSITTS